MPRSFAPAPDGTLELDVVFGVYALRAGSRVLCSSQTRPSERERRRARMLPPLLECSYEAFL
jgi:hypothetical protein